MSVCQTCSVNLLWGLVLRARDGQFAIVQSRGAGRFDGDVTYIVAPPPATTGRSLRDVVLLARPIEGKRMQRGHVRVGVSSTTQHDSGRVVKPAPVEATP